MHTNGFVFYALVLSFALGLAEAEGNECGAGNVATAGDGSGTVSGCNDSASRVRLPEPASDRAQQEANASVSNGRPAGLVIDFEHTAADAALDETRTRVVQSPIEAPLDRIGSAFNFNSDQVTDRGFSTTPVNDQLPPAISNDSGSIDSGRVLQGVGDGIFKGGFK
jgi:hypothetical protein